MAHSKFDSTSYTIKVDLDRAFKFMRTEEALRPMTKADTGDPFLDHYVGEKPRDVLWRFLKSHVHIDPFSRLVGCVDVTYAPSDIGAALIEAGLIKGCRVSATGDPFKLPMRLNEILTGSLYHNVDLSKAYQRFMRALTKVSQAQKVLDKFLADPKGMVEAVARHYFGEYNSELKERVKRVIHSLSMDKKLAAVRREFAEEYGVPETKKDHPFLVEYAKAMPLVTKEFASWDRAQEAIALIREKFPTKKGPGGKEIPRNAKLTWKSYVLQEFEWKCRGVMLNAAASYGGFGSQEHDGIKFLITDATPPPVELDALVTTAVSEAMEFSLPVETKPPAPFEFTSHDFEPRFYVHCGEVDGQHALDLYHLMMLEWCNWHFAYLTGVADGIVMTPRLSNGVFDVEHMTETTSGKLKSGRQGMDIPTYGYTTEIKDQMGEVTGVAFELGPPKPLMQWWLEHPERRPYRRLVFDPCCATKGVLNLFQGLPYDGLVIEVDNSLLDPLLRHFLVVLSRGDEKVYEYQLNWYAKALQEKTKLGTMLIYYGGMGTGKDLVVGDDGIMSFIYGGSEGHYQKMSTIEELTQRFTADAEKVLFATMTEVTPYNGRRNNDAVKDKVTAKTARHEKKNVDQKAIRDYRNLTATTNNRDGFKIELGDRRLVFIEVDGRYGAAEVHRGNITADERQRYFAHVLGARVGADEPSRHATEAEKSAVAQQFYRFLMDRDVTNFQAEDFPETAARKEVISQHKPPLEAFCESWASGQLESTEFVQDLGFSSTEVPASRIWFARDIKRKFDIFHRTEYGGRAPVLSTQEISRSLKDLPQYIRPLAGRHMNGQRYILAGHPEFGSGGVDAPAWAGVAMDEPSSPSSTTTGLSAEPSAKRLRLDEGAESVATGAGGESSALAFDEQAGTDELL